MKCKLCGPFLTLHKRFTTMLCPGDRPEAKARFRWWRDAQLNDRYLITDDPHQEAIRAAGKLEKSDPTAALDQLLALARGGSVWSMLHVGALYAHDADGAKNPVAAEHWLQLAAEHGSRRASLYLANLYIAQANFDACEKILQPCVAEGLVPAMFILGMAKLQQQPKTAKRWDEARVLLEEAATRGDLGAQWALGRRMARGWFGWHRMRRGFQLMIDACGKIEALMDEDCKKHDEEAVGAI